MSDFFGTVYRTIKEIEREVIIQIKWSNNLNSLHVLLENLYQKLNHRQMDKLEEEKKDIDMKIKT